MKRVIQNMVVVITGASAGIGRALAIALSQHGAKLVLSARREDKLVELNQSLGNQHLILRADVAKKSDCENLIARTVEHFGRLDTLVCNAGYGLARRVHETSADEIQAMFQTNVFGTLDCIRAAVPVIAKQEPRAGQKFRGQLMLVSSAAARRGLPYFGHYSATKAAQLSLAEALRVELKPMRIAVTSVHPIGTSTDFFTTAEQGTGIKVPPPGPGEIRQTPEKVASKMIAAMERPRPECWPFAPVKLLLAMNAIIPSIGDRIMQKYRGEFDAQK